MMMLDEKLSRNLQVFALDLTVDNSTIFPSTQANSRQILKSIVTKQVSSKKFISPQTIQSRKKPLVNDDLCDVVCDEEEMINQLLE
jgi:hypothetical protein